MDVLAMPALSQSSSPDYVRQCGICHKPFLKESSFNRHVLYCRRTRNRPRARARVCQACSSAKVKCNLQPQCKRCIDKGLECVYETPTSSIAVANRQRVAEDTQVGLGSHTSTPEWLADQATTQTSSELYSREDADAHMEWNLLDFDPNNIMPQSPKSLLPCLPEPDMRSDRLVSANANDYGTGIMDFRSGIFDPQSLLAPQNTQAESSFSLTRNTLSLERTNGDHLSPLPKSDPFSKYTAKVVMETLRAYPQMMLRRGTLPPFVHGHWYNEPSLTEPGLPQPLLDCMGIAQVFSSRTIETKSFLWRSIRAEQQCAVEKADQSKLSKHVLLASIQAQLIYMMMRISDNSTVEPGLNFQLLAIFQHLCERFKELCSQPFFQQENHNPSLTWEDWIFAESRRRIAIVWLLITQMVQIKIGVSCDSFPEFREIPLPAPRSLWEARTREGWQSEFDLYKARPRTGMETVGDLISASAQSDTAVNTTRLEAWNAGIDNLGLLLNLSVAVM